MSGRWFPVIYSPDIFRAVRFYEKLGFSEQYRFPDGEPGYVTMRRGDQDLGIVTTASPKELIGVEPGSEPRFELFIYVDDLDGTVDALRSQGVHVFREPEDMPWGERLAYVRDPDGNPVALAQQT